MRKLISHILLFSIILQLVSSIVLYIIPSGRVAYWTDYRLWGLSKTQWGNIHITIGFLMLVAAGFHLYFNWRVIVAYLKNKAKKIELTNKHFIGAGLITLYVFIGTLMHLPPMNGIISLGEYFTNSANSKYGEPPYGHAELSSLKMFSSKMGFNTNKAIKALNEKGFSVESQKETLLQIAEKKGVTPQKVYEIIKNDPEMNNKDASTFPDSPFPGFGNTNLQKICTEYGLPLDEVLLMLDAETHGIRKNDTIKAAASKMSLSPMEVFELLHEFVQENR